MNHSIVPPKHNSRKTKSPKWLPIFFLKRKALILGKTVVISNMNNNSWKHLQRTLKTTSEATAKTCFFTALRNYTTHPTLPASVQTDGAAAQRIFLRRWGMCAPMLKDLPKSVVGLLYGKDPNLKWSFIIKLSTYSPNAKWQSKVALHSTK